MEETQRDALSLSLPQELAARRPPFINQEDGLTEPTLLAPGRMARLQTREKSRLLLRRLVCGTFVTAADPAD